MTNTEPHDFPQRGDFYRHHNGTLYKVVSVANLDSTRPDYPITVVYQGPNGKLWAKPLDNFLSRMTPVGT